MPFAAMRPHRHDPLPLDDGPTSASPVSAVPLVSRVCRSTVTAGLPPGRAAWLIRGEAPPVAVGTDACRAAPAVRRLEVLGLPSECLWEVRVRSGQRPVFELESVPDRRGQWIMAGDMLRSMNELSGGAGIVVDLGYQPLPLPGLIVLLVVLHADPSPPAAGILAWT